jgi:hypothetical protein
MSINLFKPTKHWVNKRTEGVFSETGLLHPPLIPVVVLSAYISQALGMLTNIRLGTGNVY